MITAAQAKAKFGEPGVHEGNYMVIWTVPEDIRAKFAHVRFSALGTLGFPKKIYMNKFLKGPLEKGLRNLITRNFAGEMKTWDGCYIIRNARGLSSWSMHAWGLAIDVNAATNRLGKAPTLSSGFVKCFTDVGLDWGGKWRRPDGMHFQLAAFPA
jgi:hypothetical protein